MSEVAQSCPTLCNPGDCNLPGFSVHGIFQARVLEWVAMPFPGDVPNPGIEPRSPALQMDSLTSEPQGKPRCKLPTGTFWHPVSKCKRMNEPSKHKDLFNSWTLHFSLLLTVLGLFELWCKNFTLRETIYNPLTNVVL